MTPHIHPNYIKACNIILVTACLGIINFLLIGQFTSLYIFVLLFGIGLIALLAFLARKGYNWFKWMYLALIICGLPTSIKSLSLLFQSNIFAGCILVLHFILDIVVIILLFKIPKTSEVEQPSEIL